MIGKKEQEPVSKECPGRGHAVRGCQAMMVAALLVFFSGCTCTEESYCDISQQFSFLPVGTDIVGDWYWEGDDEETTPEFRFNEKGCFVHYRFGCGNTRFPIVPEGMNTARTDAGYQCTTLMSYVIEPGRFRMEYETTGRKPWIEVRLLSNGKLMLESDISSSISGTFVKRPPSTEVSGSLASLEQP